MTNKTKRSLARAMKELKNMSPWEAFTLGWELAEQVAQSQFQMKPVTFPDVLKKPGVLGKLEDVEFVPSGGKGLPEK